MNKYTDALCLATTAHAGQFRKGTNIPYITHPVAVSALVAQYGGDEDQQIAALLHDTLEDGGRQYAQEIQRQFGGRVLSMVESCTDGTPDETGRKAPWRGRKEQYLAHLAEATDEALLVSACDKLSNARAILDDILNPDVGLCVFDRFSASKEETLWYYAELARIFTSRRSPVAPQLSATIVEIQRLGGV